MTEPRVHVAIPVRGVAPWLDQALESLVAQSYRAWQACVVVDADRNEHEPCFEIAERWALADERIECIRVGRLGLPSALNLALSRAGDCEYLARFDGDDICEPERFACQIDFLDRCSAVDVLDSRALSFRSPGDGELPEGMKRYQHWHDSIETHADFEREFLVENPVCHPTVMMRAETLGRLGRAQGPYRDLDVPEDYDLWLRLLQIGARFHKLDRALVRWRDHSGRSTRTSVIYEKAAFFRAKWAYFQAQILPGLESLAVCGAGREGRRWIRALTALGAPLKAVSEISPKAIGSTRHGVPVVENRELGVIRPQLALIAVGTAGARTMIEQELAEMGVPHLAVAGIAG